MLAEQTATVDVEDPTTWPEPVREWVRRQAEQPEITVDPPAASLMEQEHELRALLAGHKVRAYHCTRLLEHEIAGVRDHGLRRLTPTLIAERIAAAHAAGALGDDLRGALSGRTVFDLEGAEHREGRVCTVLGRTPFDDAAYGAAPRLEIWGGEGIYRAWDFTPTEEELKRIGRPAMVVCRIDVSDAERAWAYCLALPFVARLRGEKPDCEVHYMADVPGEDVLAIWQPGDPEYDRHDDLPTE